MPKIKLYSDQCWLATDESNGNLRGQFSICNFSKNLNQIMLNRETIEEWMQSLVNQPLVAKLVPGKYANGLDFAGHEVTKMTVTGDDGTPTQVVAFDTDAFGTFTEVSIGEVDGEECLLATAEIWNRYPRAIQLIRDRASKGTLRTSWEIDVSDYTFNKGVKTINNGVFTAVALLGDKVQPAYPNSARLLQVATEMDYDDALLLAISEDLRDQDMKKKTQELSTGAAVTQELEAGKPESQDTAEANGAVTSENPDSNSQIQSGADNGNSPGAETAGEGKPNDFASLTMRDLRIRIEQAIFEKNRHVYCWISFIFPEEHIVWVETEDRQSELDYVLYNYSVEGDAVTVDDGTPVKLSVSITGMNDRIAVLEATIAEAAAENETLREQIASLEEIKSKYDAVMAEQAAKEAEAQKAELRAYAEKSGMFTEGELKQGNVKKLIESLDKAKINELIAERYMQKLAEKKEISTRGTSSMMTSTVHSVQSDLDSSVEKPHKTAIQYVIES